MWQNGVETVIDSPENRDRTPPAAGPSGLLLAALAASFVALIHVAWWFFGDTLVVNGNFFDGDSYARLVRVERLVETGGWLDSSLPRANAPFGGSLHWTRPFDVMLIALAMPLEPLLGFKQALFWSGAIISPLLHVLLAVTLVWAAAPLIGRTGAAIAGALTVVHLGILGYATVGHADHHVLFGLIAVGAFGFTIRALSAAEDGSRPAFWAGAVLAAGFWVGTEAQVTIALCFLAAGLAWVSGAPGGARTNQRLALGLALGVALALAVERGPAGYLDVQYDRLSIVHLTSVVLLLAFWSAVSALAGRAGGRPGSPGARLGVRLGAGVLGAAAIAGVTWVLFPDVLQGPMAQFDPALLPILEHVPEYSPLGDVWHFLFYVGTVIVAAPWMVWRLIREWRKPERWAWFLIAAALAVYMAFAVNWVRWSLYAGLVLSVFLADLIVAADAAIDRRFVFPRRLLVKTAAILILAAGPLVIGAAGIYGQAKATSKPGDPVVYAEDDPRPCPLQAMSRQLNAPPWDARPRTILASPNFGAELLYRTPHKVLGTFHHPNAPGILDGVRILGGAEESETLGLIRKRKIDLILICLNSGRAGYIRGRDDEGILYRRLEDGNLPRWLREIEVPGNLGRAFRLFEVIAPG